MPRHIAVIMDGNGRWAKKNFLPRVQGHWEGVKTVDRVVTLDGVADSLRELVHVQLSTIAYTIAYTILHDVM